LNVLLTGATGFIGRYVVEALLARGHTVTAVGRDAARARSFGWYGKVTFVAADIHSGIDAPSQLFGPADVVMHLAWPGLPNHKELFHFEENLPRDYRFLKSLVSAGYRRLLVSGTCLECGMQSGCLTEAAEARPTIPYTIAKATLHTFLQALQKRQPFDLQWARVFYMYGEGQTSSSVLAQLDRAIDSGVESFDMSGGEQLRDYSPVTDIAAKLVTLAEHPEWLGVTNICNGKPTSVRTLVERHIAARGARIRLNLGVYPYPEHEPMAFWGTSSRAL
jgi:nucleoside-diphosphate-sugar epimerase